MLESHTRQICTIGRHNSNETSQDKNEKKNVREKNEKKKLREDKTEVPPWDLLGRAWGRV